MGIQINGSTDRITAIDGTIDFVSNIGEVGYATARDFTINRDATIGSLGISTNLTVTGVSTFTGNVLVGTTTATSEFTVRGSGTVAAFEGTGGSGSIMIKDVDDGTLAYALVDGGNFDIQTSGSSYATKLRVTPAGNLGLGNHTPDSSLHIKNTGQVTYIKDETTHTSSTYTGLNLKTPTLNFQIWNQGPGATGYSGANSVVFWQAAATGPYAFYHGSNERLRIASDGKVGVGELAPAYQLDVKGDSGISIVASSNSTYGQLSIMGRNSSGQSSAISRLKSYPDGSSAQSQFAIETRNSSNAMVERLRINSDGKLLVGTTSSSNLPGGFHNTIQVEGTSADSSSISITRNSNDINPPYLNFGKSRGTSAGSNTAVAEDDNIGQIDWLGSDGSGGYGNYANLTVSVDGTPGNSDHPGRMVFKVGQNGSNSLQERLRISEDGSVKIHDSLGVGNVDPGGATLNVNGNLNLSAGGLTSWQKVTIAGSGNASGDDLTINNWGNADGDYWVIGTNITSNAGGSTTKTNNTNRSAALLLDGRIGRLTLSTSQSGTSTTTDTHTWTRDGNYTLTGNVVVANAKGIDFSATGNSNHVTDNELLNDYERGTWNPGFTFGGGNSGWGWSSEGHYQKVGQVVTCIGQLDFNAKSGSSSTGEAKLTGLPYNVGDIMANTSQEGCGWFTYFGYMNTSSYSHYDFWTIGGSSNCSIQRHNNSSSVSTANHGDFASNTQLRFYITYFVNPLT